VERHWRKLEVGFGWALILVGLYLLWSV